MVRLSVEDTEIYILHRCVVRGVEDRFESGDAPLSDADVNLTDT